MEAAREATGTVPRVDAALAGLEHVWLAPRDGLPAIAIAPAILRAVLERLKSRAGFESMTFISAVDRLPAAPRFELVHQLWSLAHGDRVRLHARLAEGESAASCVDLWPGAAYMERECFDMFGIPFAGHAGLKRLLMPDDYGHHPLRKDFPHQGIEPDRLYREWDRRRRAAWQPRESAR
jgi:NADH-quinone oxidoreductase subunit C